MLNKNKNFVRPVTPSLIFYRLMYCHFANEKKACKKFKRVLIAERRVQFILRKNVAQ